MAAGFKCTGKAANLLPGRLVLGTVGLLLLLYAVLIPLLGVLGERTIAQVNVVRRELGDRQDPIANRYSWAVGFEFRLPDGRLIPGNTKVIGSDSNAGIAKGPHPVRYFSSFPYLNALEQDTRLDGGKFVMLGFGSLLFVLALRLKK